MSHSPLLLQLVIILGTARVLGLILRYFGQSAVIGEMAAGIVLGPIVFGALSPQLHAHDVPWTAPAAGHGSSHALGIADAIALGHALDRLPGELVLYTVEGADFRLGAPVTPAVRHAIGEIATTVADLVRP